MAKKQPRVPEMREVKPNRKQRRHPESQPEDEPLAREKRLRRPGPAPQEQRPQEEDGRQLEPV